MTNGFYSKILADKKWIKCPKWAKTDGTIVEITFGIEKMTSKWERFVEYNKKLYPDLVSLGILEKLVEKGIKKE